MADNFLESKIKDGKVTLFVKGGCPYSRNAVDMLRRYNFAPGCLQVFDINESRDAQDYFQATGQSPMPRVFIGRHCIGGLSDLESMRCRLPAMLRQIGALR
ncbi:glutaredoxin-1-like [Haliaeetus albicilla]|nr:GLRX1 protein [Haliaeetus albicilla]NWZ60710.1 GLRX1 protein [Haliaeetus albicilla]